MALCVQAKVAVLAILLGGCGSTVYRRPVPANLRDHARVPGMPDGIRAWGDQFSPAFQQSLADSGPQAEKAYTLDQIPTNALAISGGGSNGAFAAGLICGWTRHGDRPRFRLVTGISAGAIVAPFAFLGPAYDGPLKRVATEISDNKVFRTKSLLAVFGSDSLDDTRPLAAFLSGFYDQKLIDAVAAEGRKGRRVFVATTDLDAQRPVLWDMTKIASAGGDAAVATFRRVLLASAAQPVLFPPVYLKVQAGGKDYDEMHVDGGVSTQVVLYGNVIHLPELVRRHAAEMNHQLPKPIVYVIRNAKIDPEPQDVPPHLLDIAGRAVNLLVKNQGEGDLYKTYDICKRDGLDFRLAAIPDDVATDSGTGFKPKIIHQLFDRGFASGAAGVPWLNQPPGLSTASTRPAGQLP